MEKEKIKQTEQNETPDNRRTVFIGAKVSPRQKEHIKSLAEQCGMTVSDYLLARAYNYKPKARLSKEEAALLQNLDNCRADLVKYTSALHGNVCQFLNSMQLFRKSRQTLVFNKFKTCLKNLNTRKVQYCNI